MLKIARPVSFLLLSVALCSSGVIFAANETTTPKVGISQQQASLKGVVEDEFGPVAGASVVVKGTTNGTVTDMNGNFVLEVKKGDVIVISFIGYLTQEIKYNGEQTIKVSLKEDTQKLDEVVVIGYGTQKKVNLTGAVASVGSEELKERVNTDVLASVQGQVPGVTIINRQGSISINMRGRGNLGTSSPLFVIDGAIADATFFSNLDPNSIESVSFLKDAASSAIYGSRAAYGVVLVKTKDGKEGDVKVTYDGTVSMKIATYTPKVLSSEWYARLSNEAAFNENPNAEMPYSDEEIEMFRNGSNPDMYPNTNWYDLVLDDLAVMTKHSVSVSGGNKVKYFTSLGYMYDDKFTPGASANRYNMTTNLSSDITSWLSWRSNFKYIQNTNNTESGGIGYTELLTVPSTYVARQSNGEWGSYEGGNPAALVNMQRNPLRRLEEGGWNNNKSQNTLIDLALDIKPVKGLTLTGQMIYKAYDYKGKTYEANRNKIKDFVTGSELNGTDVTASKMTYDWNENSRLTYNGLANYNWSNENHNISALGGVSYEHYKYQQQKSWRRNFPTNGMTGINGGSSAPSDMSTEGDVYEDKLMSYFARLNYSYKDRYLLEANFRADASSRFHKDNRWGFFPSFSAGWRVSEEAFFTQAKNYVSNLKLRLSYGSLGNQKTVGYYDYLQLINTGAVMNYAFGDTTKGDYAYESAPNSTDLTWETVITKNIGLDLGFLNNRLNVSFDAYIRDTKDMLMAGKTLPGVYGASSPRMNVADLRTKGWEASVTWGDSFTLASKPFNYRIMAGIGDNTSKVTKYDNPNRTLTDPYEGQQLGEIWGYVVDGYFKTDEEARNYKVDQSFVNQMINASALDNGLHAGDLKFVDLDGNNKIEQTTSANDRKDMKVIGNSLPRYNYNFGISADWYGIDFSVLFQGIGKQNWYPGAETSMFWGPYSRPYASFIPSDFMSQVWSEENTNAYFPRPRGYVALGSNRELAVVNTKYLQNLAYCRLKNLSIGYTLPDKWLSKIGFEKIRVYFSGENLLTFTKLHSDYIDPEQASASNSWKTSKSDANIYPWAKTYSFGVDITF